MVYRRYAGLFFCLCVDANDNELAYLEAIHLFVEILGIIHRRVTLWLSDRLLLDTFFDNVCELDLVFNFYKVRYFPGTIPAYTVLIPQIGLCYS